MVLTSEASFLMVYVPPLRGTVSAGDAIEGRARFFGVLDILSSGRPMGANQIHQHQNTGIFLISHWTRPEKQLIGLCGSPNNSVIHRLSHGTARHRSRILVGAFNMVFGVGNDRTPALGQASKFYHLGVIITNSAVFNYGKNGTLQLSSVYLGNKMNKVIQGTGSELDLSTAITNRVPTGSKLRLIREFIDPRGRCSREVPSTTKG